jgi:hypothetical protein
MNIFIAVVVFLVLADELRKDLNKLSRWFNKL